MSQPDEYKGFAWKGKMIRTYGEIGAAACALETAQEAAEFLDAYATVNRYASSNIGYLMGYYGAEERERVYRLMDEAGRTDVQHPIFGGGFGRGQDPTPEQAFAAGQKLARNLNTKKAKKKKA